MSAAKILIGLAFAVSFLYRLVFWCGHPLLCFSDQSEYLAMAQLLLMGKVPYVDFVDVNPPLIMYMSTIPWLIAGVFNCPITFAFIIFIYALAAGSLALVWFVFDCNKDQAEYKYRWFILFALLVVTQAQQSDFGQREHIFALLFLPYVILRCFVFGGGAVPRPLAIIIGILGGLGACLKPNFGMILVAFELALQLNKRQLKALLNWECRSVFLVAALYLAHILFLSRAALDVFINHGLALYRDGNNVFFTSIISGLSLDPPAQWSMYSLALVAILSVILSRRSLWIIPICALVFASFASYLEVGLTWHCKMLPMDVFLYLLLGLEIGMVCDIALSKIPSQRVARLIRAASPYALFLICCSYGYSRGSTYIEANKAVNQFGLTALGYSGTNPDNELDPVFHTILKYTDKHDPIVVIGPGVYPGYPATLQADRLPGSRYLHGMMLRMLQYCRKHYPGKKYDELEKVVVENYGQDILKNRPKLVLISDESIKIQLDQYQFISTYLKDYESFGSLHKPKFEVFKLKEALSRNSQWSVEKRRQLILKILTEKLTIEQAVADNGLSRTQVGEWVKRADAALDSALTDNAGGGSIETVSAWMDSLEKIKKQDLEISDLKMQLEMIKSRQSKGR